MHQGKIWLTLLVYWRLSPLCTLAIFTGKRLAFYWSLIVSFCTSTFIGQKLLDLILLFMKSMGQRFHGEMNMRLSKSLASNTNILPGGHFYCLKNVREYSLLDLWLVHCSAGASVRSFVWRVNGEVDCRWCEIGSTCQPGVIPVQLKIPGFTE